MENLSLQITLKVLFDTEKYLQVNFFVEFLRRMTFSQEKYR